jgi:DNA-binding NtrC family response regulator
VDLPAGIEGELAQIFEDLHRRLCRQGGRERLTLREWLERAEAWRIGRALHEAGGNRSAAARALGIGRRTLYTKLAKLGLAPGAPASSGGLARNRTGAAPRGTAPVDSPAEAV